MQKAIAMDMKDLFKRFIHPVIALFLLSVNYYCKKQTDTPEPQEDPFTIENLGVSFGAWDKQTNQAGDFDFSSALQFTKIFSEFGAQTKDPQGQIKELPTMDFIIRSDAFIVAIAEGEVTRMVYQEGSADYEFSIQSLNDPSYVVVYDHLVNLKIQTGDLVQPGDHLGNPRPWTSEIGGLEIMVNNLETKLSVCPLCYMNEETLEINVRNISQLMNDWEEFKNDTTIYDQENHIIPGCRYESMVSY
jgi:hypothetical protein